MAGALVLVAMPPAMHAHNIVQPLDLSDSIEKVLEAGTLRAGDRSLHGV
jgi:hypothetical protein